MPSASITESVHIMSLEWTAKLLECHTIQTVCNEKKYYTDMW